MGKSKKQKRKEDEERKKKLHKLELTRTAKIQRAAFRGMLIYIQNPGLSIRAVWEQGRMDEDEDSELIREVLSYATFEKIATRSQWATKRDAHWEEIERRVMEQAQSDMVQKMLDELDTLQGVEAVLINNIQGVTDGAGNILIDPAKPKSLEGLVRAMLSLDKWRQSKRDSIIDRMSTGIQGDPTEQEDGDVIDVTADQDVYVEDELDDEEARKLALTVAKMRANMIEGPDPEDTDDEDSE